MCVAVNYEVQKIMLSVDYLLICMKETSNSSHTLCVADNVYVICVNLGRIKGFLQHFQNTVLVMFGRVSR